MNITYLVGNGFDLNLGLDTRYTDFLKVYRPDTSDSHILRNFKEQIANNLPLWANAELAFGEYTSNFSSADDFCDCHMDFCDQLATYLEMQESKLNFESLKPVIPALFAKSIQSYQSGFREEQRQSIQKSIETMDGGFIYNFVSFNYTKTLDECFTLTKNNLTLGKRKHFGSVYENAIGRLLHVHGFTNKDMVLGVNDESQIKNPSLFEGQTEEYIGQIIKKKTNQLNEEHMDEKCTELINSSQLIYIYGMSIGETDAIWWNRICTALTKNPHMRVIVYAFDAPKEERIRRKYLQFERTMKEKFVNYSNLDDTAKRSIMNRIHISTFNVFEPIKNLVRHEQNKAKVAALT